MTRNKTDQELETILEGMNESERTGLMFAMLPYRLHDLDLSNADVARLMELNPKGHY